MGTPQGSILSPRRCNIYRHELDRFVDNKMYNFSTNRLRRRNPEYAKLLADIKKRRETDPQSAIKLQRKLREIPRGDPFDKEFIKIKYVRYADDFLIGVTGPKYMANQLRDEIKDLMTNKLKRELSPDKTAVKSSSQEVKFLGAMIKTLNPNDGLVKLKKTNGRIVRSRITPRIRMTIPVKTIMRSLANRGFFKIRSENEVTSRPRYGLINLDHSDIVAYYNAVVRGRVNYYSFADNRSSRRSIIWQRHKSCIATLMQKFKLKSSKAAFHKFGKRIADPKSGKKRYLPTDLKRIREFQTGKDVNLSVLVISWANKRTQSNLNKACLVCGSTQGVEMHHLRSLSDVKKKIRDKKLGGSWTSLQMAAINRKQVPVCTEHHRKIHAGTLSDIERTKFEAGCMAIVRSRRKKTKKNSSE